MHKVNEGQLLPIDERMSPAQQARRQDRIEARATVADKLRQMAGIAMAQSGLAIQLRQIGFFGRLWWLLTGRAMGTGRLQRRPDKR